MHHAEQGLPHGNGALGDRAIAWFRWLIVDQFVRGAFEQLARHAGCVFEEGVVCFEDCLDGSETGLGKEVSTFVSVFCVLPTYHSGVTAAIISGGTMGVSTIPGMTTLMRIFSFCLSSGATPRTKWLTAALVPQ